MLFTCSCMSESPLFIALKKQPHYIDNHSVQFKQSSRVLFEQGHMLHWTRWIKPEHHSARRHGELYRMILARCILSLAGYGPWERKAFLTARPAQGKLWEQDWQTQRTAMKRRPYAVTFCCHWLAWKDGFHHPHLIAGSATIVILNLRKINCCLSKCLQGLPV